MLAESIIVTVSFNWHGQFLTGRSNGVRFEGIVDQIQCEWRGVQVHRH